MSLVEPTAKANYCMSDIKQADAMVRMAHRDRTALHGMLDVSVFADEISGSMPNKPLKRP